MTNWEKCLFYIVLAMVCIVWCQIIYTALRNRLDRNKNLMKEVWTRNAQEKR